MAKAGSKIMKSLLGIETETVTSQNPVGEVPKS